MTDKTVDELIQYTVEKEFIEAVIQIIDTMANRGAILGPELIQIGMVRQYAAEKLN